MQPNSLIPTQHRSSTLHVPRPFFSSKRRVQSPHRIYLFHYSFFIQVHNTPSTTPPTSSRRLRRLHLSNSIIEQAPRVRVSDFPYLKDHIARLDLGSVLRERLVEIMVGDPKECEIEASICILAVKRVRGLVVL